MNLHACIGIDAAPAKTYDLLIRPADPCERTIRGEAVDGPSQEMEIHKQVDHIESRQDLVEFIKALRNDLLTHPSDWENPTLERFPDALAGSTEDMDGYFRNRGELVPSQPSWRLVGNMLHAAKIYE